MMRHTRPFVVSLEVADEGRWGSRSPPARRWPSEPATERKELMGWSTADLTDRYNAAAGGGGAERAGDREEGAVGRADGGPEGSLHRGGRPPGGQPGGGARGQGG